MNAPDAALNAAISPPSEDGFFRPDPALSERIVQATGRPARVVPAELVALFDVALPIRGQRAQRAALAFAVEDMIGQPLDAVHVAYCRIGAVPGNVLAAVVDRKVMALAKDDAPVLPEAFAIPAPEASPIGPAWAVWNTGTRVVVRRSDGTGFGTSTANLRALWRIAGEPGITGYGVPLPGDIPARHSDILPAPHPADMAVDLRQGSFAPRSDDWRPTLRRTAAVLAFCVFGHLAIAGADLWALGRIADTQQRAAEAALAPVLPGVVLPQEPTQVLARLAAPPGAGASQGTFLPLISGVSEVLLSEDPPVTWRRISFSHETGQLSILVEARGLDGLQASETALERAGYRIESGAAVASEGSAEAEFRISEAGR